MVYCSWKHEFYGADYDRLVEIELKYDPEHFFYAYTGVCMVVRHKSNWIFALTL